MTPDLGKLFTPYQMGPFKLPHRIVMAPLTRLRAGPRQVPTPLNALYYGQRASAALVIGEATYVAPEGYGYCDSPGIVTDEQVEGHKILTQAVHNKGGLFFLQLWHVGRISHPSMQPNGQLPVAPSAIGPKNVRAATPDGLQPIPTPRALETAEIQSMVVEPFRQAARNAKRAGYDGIEVHSANGYLLEQFLSDGTNHRTDQYGGSVENRFRLLKEVCEAVIEAWDGDASRVGVRLSPSGTFNDMSDSDYMTHWTYVIKELNKFGLAYLHVVEPRIDGSADKYEDANKDWCSSWKNTWREMWSGTYICAGGYTRRTGEAALREDGVDLVCYGRKYISNPDLPERFALAARAEKERREERRRRRVGGNGNGNANGGEVVLEEEKEEEEEDDDDKEFVTPYQRETFYGGGKEGYTDFPFWEEGKGGGGGEEVAKSA